LTRRSSSIPAAEKKPAGNTASGVLHRSCACGQHTSAGGQCDACRKAQESGVPSIVGEVLDSPGEPLPSGARDLMERRFNRDFSSVRVHADSRASESAGAVNARAWTVGDHIAFQHGQYNPQSRAGRSLLAHELTHVAQNQGGPRRPGAVNAISHPHDPSEREASDAASRVTAGGSVSVSQNSSAVMHRDLSSGAIGGIVAGSIAGAGLIGLGIAALAGAFDSHPAQGQASGSGPAQSTVPDLPADLVQRLQPACTSGATAEVRQAALDALAAWAHGQSSIGVDWSRVTSVTYDTAPDAAGSSTNADDTQHIRIKLGPEAFSSVANLYSTLRHELVHTQEHETRPRADILSRGRGAQEIYAYLWELEHQQATGLARRENWGLRADGTADHSVGLARVVDGVIRSMFAMSADLSQNNNAIPSPEQSAIERRVACAMIATPREVVAGVLPNPPLQRWQQECSQGVPPP
jgi:hypothetical protein